MAGLHEYMDKPMIQGLGKENRLLQLPVRADAGTVGLTKWLGTSVAFCGAGGQIIVKLSKTKLTSPE